MDNIIEVSGITKRYGDFVAVDSLSFSIGKGEVFGLLGPNGAGKSTTILVLMGLTEPNSGKLSVCGIDPIRNPIQVKKKVGYLPEDVGFYEDYSGLENLVFTARLNGITKSDARIKALQLMDKVGLSEEKNKKVGKYSRGMRQRLGLADVLIKNPEVIILDEPTIGIDPSGVKEFLEQIVELSRKERITVLFSSHLLHQVQQVCDRVGIFVKGRLLAEGNIENLSKHLFSDRNCLIEGEIESISSESKVNNRTADDLQQELQRMEGVIKVTIKDSYFFIEAVTDITANVSRYIISLGFGLTYLKKKVFGLDEIYHRYFQDSAPV
ncbi:MAG: ABC transporter ATP-binding protein [Bacteroidales bacterium]|nr:ABC transporter ATP-binding protein [Bacteroidales bacterium]